MHQRTDLLTLGIKGVLANTSPSYHHSASDANRTEAVVQIQLSKLPKHNTSIAKTFADSFPG